MKKTYIYYARRKAGKTQADIAKALGLVTQTYANKEQRLDFSPEEMLQLSKILKINPNNIVNERNIVNEPEINYGTGGSEYRRLLKELSDIKKMIKEIHEKIKI